MKMQLTNQSYQSRSVASTGQRLVNMYVEANPEGSKYPYTLFNIPGLKLWKNLNSSPIYGAAEMGGSLYVVAGNEVYKVETDATSALLGTIGVNSSPVLMENNGTEMAIQKQDGTAYVSTTTTVTQITDASFPSVSSMTYMDGYHIFSRTGTNQFIISGLLNATAYDATDFSSASEKSDYIVRVFSFNSGLWLFGESSIEVFYNSGAANFPFEQISGAVNTSRGCASIHSVVQEDNRMFWLGDDRVVYTANGYSPERISNHAIEQELGGYSTVSDARGSIYTQDGHKFYLLVFPTARKLWVFDISNGLWHEREGLNSIRYQVDYVINFAGKVLGCDYETGNLYELDVNTFTDNGVTRQCYLVTPPQWAEGKRVTYDRIRLDVDAGLGLTNGQGSDPQLVMKYSDDGGNIWSNEKWVSVGKIGEYKNRSVWRRLGTSRERIFKFTYSEPTPFRVTGFYADVRVGGE